MTASTSLYDIGINRLDGASTTLGEYAGKVLLIVNTASACGLTPQYAGLEALYRKYRERGLVVLGFPCNQFGGQEPGDAAQIQTFCSTNYDLSFPLFAKIDVNGPHTHPLYTALKRARPRPDGAADIQWNFAKFLVGRDGAVRARFDPRTPPEQLVPEIEAALG
ncbi:MAG TPA: glutathione peroxidase [Polyangiaceae bacterium]|nr:glutathione peroxidase [Polyangiaceae bacterium]